ncbi:MAG: DUF4065 domain-containing protein [Sphingomonas sp.]|uniref:Panacea domain-containing protein n=1 Tax=Sphingomonas sp. TaxID=28214 RepID=UPI0025E288D8|nr:type II toxin-antitoxin system antitoxin SocA domain-containing protein [Sphingomonas sp.]MBQ1498462.1 DUF4065 domain-containing protein [Sphingomonas sp.]
MSFPALKVANELLQLHGDIDPMKLQKLLYYANGWWLATHGAPLLNENPQVWRYGPVFRGLYGAFARFGRDDIGGPVRGGPFTADPPFLTNELDAVEARQLLAWIWDEHGSKSAIQLSDETHAPGTPWRKIAERHNFRVPEGTPIPPREDWAYFAELAQGRGVATRPLAA